MAPPTGWSATPGTQTGVTMASLRSSEDRITVASSQRSWLESHVLPISRSADLFGRPWGSFSRSIALGIGGVMGG